MPFEVVIKTFIRHTRRKGHKLEEGDKTEDAYDDIFYDEYVARSHSISSALTWRRAFHIVKAFIELGTKNTVESLQELYGLLYTTWTPAHRTPAQTHMFLRLSGAQWSPSRFL